MPDICDVIARETITIFSLMVKQKKQVSPQILSEMYAGNAHISGLLTCMMKNQEVQDTRDEVERLKELLNRTKLELSEVEFKEKKKADILFKVIRTLSILSTSDNQKTNSLIEKLTEYIKSEKGFNEELIVETLGELRQEVLNAENTDKQVTGKKRTFLGELFKTGKATGDGASAYQKIVKDLLISIILRLQVQHADFDKKVHSLAEEIKKRDLGELKDTKADICELLGSYRERLNEEKTTLYELVQEIATTLVDTEKDLLSFFSESQVSRTRYNSEFNESFAEDIKGIEEGLLQGNTIEGIKRLVFEKLGSIKTSLNKKRELDQKVNAEARTHIEHFTTELKHQEQEIRKVRERTDLDALTGIYNRSAFQQRLKEEVKEQKETGAPASLIVFDLDNFRKINEEYTFDNGDRILKTIAQVVTEKKPEEYYFAACGGGEFALLLPVSVEKAENFAENIRKIIMEIDFCHLERKVPVSISLGVAQFEGEKNPLHILQKAHNALSEAKRRGKNQVSVTP
jgi:diguanylate cyclase (GGDEF)-like protein